MSGRTADAVVIGGGVIGLSIAFQLAQERFGSVVVVERNYVCSGTTGQSGAIIRQHYSNDFTAAMARDSLTMFPQLGRRDRRRRCPVRANRRARPDRTRIRTGGSAKCRLAPTPRHRLAPDRSRRASGDRTPRRVDGLSSACWEATAGIADPVATVHALAAAFQREGGALA